ncbi:hypothetical protein HWV01_11995 [Moritella sp. 5]|uniref:hypothetical protein n=1 Tax=Moritella sp. 5 TaxID=2746231 RepID=UPI001BA5FC3E|nr:hypothetical protein [Moritella sp. 5]QUM80949.1 hypothetical protein HWV01_11995 [Moritella sp. 5]
MKKFDMKIIIVSALITTIVGCGSGGGSSETTVIKESAVTCFGENLYQVGEYDIEYKYKSDTRNGFTRTYVEVSQLEDKIGSNQFEMRETYPGVFASVTDTVLIWPGAGWVELKGRVVIKNDAPQISKYKFDTVDPLIVGWFSLREGEHKSISTSYDLQTYSPDLSESIKNESENFEQKVTFVGFKNINIKGVDYNTCQITDEQIYNEGTITSQVFYQTNTGLPLKKITLSKRNDGKTDKKEETLISYQFNGTELLN